MTPLERATQALQGITIFWDETYDGAFVVKGDPIRYATNAEAEKAQAEAQVRAVIAALRDPSEAMIEAANSAAPGHVDMHDFIVEDMAAPVWSAMIDALLGEKPCTAAS